MHAENRVSHALMFTGPEGCGKLALAIAFAQYLNCLHTVDGDSCGECTSCKKHAKLVHPDLHFVFPVVKTSKNNNPVSDTYIQEWRDIVLQKKYFNLNQWFTFLEAEKAQGIIYSQESHEIIKKLNLKTFEGKFKVMIIWQPEKMHLTASNKLLKILEEPPAGTVFILVSDKPENVISTITSRVQQIKIPRFEESAIISSLIDEFELSNDEANTMARLANGDIVLAREMVSESEEREFFFNHFVSLMRNSYSRKLAELIEWVEDMSRLSREKQKSFLEYGIRLIRENFILNLKESSITYMTPKEAQFSERFSPFINDNNAMQMAEEMNLAHAHIEQNGNGRIIFMDLTLKIIILLKTA
jgi:DNA polymerase-3 subunit delta'